MHTRHFSGGGRPRMRSGSLPCRFNSWASAARTSLIIAELAGDMEAIEHVRGLPGALGGEPLEEALEGLALALLADPQPSGGSAAGSVAPGVK